MHKYLNESISADEYFQIRENSEALLEYIDGFVYMSPSPSTKHQRISRKLQIKFGNLLEGNPCELFSAPYDIELKNDKIDGTKIIIPDISIICDKSGFTDARYVGVPNLIVEILSPSNQSHDLITKLNLYMNYGVKEYWIVNPMLNSITVYALNDEKMYEQHDMKTETGEITSKFLNGFRIDLTSIFAN
ncbi:Uma2 family endonuclease [Aquibacillus sp. 3ASR75-11]|uniref:Uma2 family endonuclease n=1 Tax=Terrihalobacillus insolitus TaxID=2950438 RepID=A0A9X4ANY5_9BACI|nr:Uma2 family endonuclease [Terrihalobacillus insolitus]MDC3413688.1 Uma2 family endonuclease [Terrihalobacillus insolitus]MDC3426294.1 Uma2 family endonuclease [Terrihalobacillus insolitus]